MTTKKNTSSNRNQSPKENFVEVESPDDFSYEGKQKEQAKNRTPKRK